MDLKNPTHRLSDRLARIDFAFPWPSEKKLKRDEPFYKGGFLSDPSDAVADASSGGNA
jgi:hypothetical protein